MKRIPTKRGSRKKLPPPSSTPSAPVVSTHAIRGALAELLALGNFDARFAALLLQKNEVNS